MLEKLSNFFSRGLIILQMYWCENSKQKENLSKSLINIIELCCEVTTYSEWITIYLGLSGIHRNQAKL